MANPNPVIPYGNINAAKGKLFFDALHKAIKSGTKGNQLNAIANRLIDIALNGDSDSAQLQAIAMIMDRLDGKAKQQIDMSINAHDVSIDLLG